MPASVSLDGVNTELRQRIEWMLAKAEGRFWITTGYRDATEQIRLWNAYQKAKAEHPSHWQQYAQLAAVPGTSKHGENYRARTPDSLAVDLACQPEDNKLREDLGNEAGLYCPIAGEPWHHELHPRRGPLPTSTKPTPVSDQIPTEDEDDMKLEAVWNDGTKVRLLPDGGIFNFGSPYFGNLKDIPAAAKTVTKEVGDITVVDANDNTKGYIIWGLPAGRYEFNAQTKADIDAALAKK